MSAKQNTAARVRKIELAVAIINGQRAREELAHLTARFQREPSPHNHAALKAASAKNATAMARIMIAVEAHPVKERFDLWDKVHAKLKSVQFPALGKPKNA